MKTESLNTAQGPIEYMATGSGLPILAIHGSPGGWEQMMAEFSFLSHHGFQIIAPNRPGYAGTPLSSGKTVSEQATLLGALMEQLGHSRYAIAAWSGGGPSAIQLAADAPKTVSKLYLQACITKKTRYSEKEQKLIEPLFNPQVATVTKWVTHWRPKFILKMMIQGEYDCSKSEAKKRSKKLLQDHSILAYTKEIINSMIPPNQRETGFRNDNCQFEKLQQLPFHQIIAPTLILQGKLDWSVTPTQAEHAHQHISHSKLLLLDDVTHMPRLSTHYAMIKEAIMDFFLHPDSP